MTLKTFPHSMDEVAILAHNAGFRSDGLITSIAVIWAESGGNAWAVNINSNPGKPTHGSMDLGLAQFNTYWWPAQKANDLMKPEYNVNLMFKASRNGTYFGYWSAFVYGYHKKYISFAQEAVKRLGLV